MMEQRYHWYDYITINIYWLGLNMPCLAAQRSDSPARSRTACRTGRRGSGSCPLATTERPGRLEDVKA